MNVPKNQNGYTLMEIMIVIIIIGVLATLAIPNYTKTVDRSRLQDAMQQLTALQAANMIYRAQSGTGFLTGTNLTYGAVNTSLGINIIPNGFTYNYTGTTSAFTATATLGTAYTVTVTEADIETSTTSCSGSPSGNPCCAALSGGTACP